MSELTLYKDVEDGNTVIANCFIDNYLAAANDAQIKVYLYLSRMMNANRPTSITDIADKFNHTEKDVCRSLKYWEQNGLLSLEYDNAGTICGIRLIAPKFSKSRYANRNVTSDSSFTPFVTLVPGGLSEKQTCEENVNTNDSNPVFEKPSYSLDDLKIFKNREDTAQILFIAEQYLKKTLSANDIRSILFITDYLHFSDDLIDYLLQYCVQRGKKDFRYIEKVAINWAEEKVSTPKEAQNYSGKYDKSVYTIMNALGKSNSSPTPKEVDFIKRWNNELGFTQDVILEACERTVLATDNHRFEYADKILESWKKAGVHHKKDIIEVDNHYKKAKTNNNNTQKITNTMFHQFKQNDYDFNAIEEKLLSRK